MKPIMSDWTCPHCGWPDYTYASDLIPYGFIVPQWVIDDLTLTEWVPISQMASKLKSLGKLRDPRANDTHKEKVN